jgi:hypothetical protein
MKNLRKIVLTSGLFSLLLVGLSYGVVREGNMEVETDSQVEVDNIQVESDGEIEVEVDEDEVNSPRIQEVAPGQDYNSSRSNKPSREADLEEENETEEEQRGQDYNSSRSNRPEADADSDGDGIDDGEE